MRHKSIRKTIAIVHNLSSGGAIKVYQETLKYLLEKYNVETFTPTKLTKRKSNPILQICSYLKYIYLTLPSEYSKIAAKINNGNYSAVIVHPDNYIKAPILLRKAKTKTIYLLNEPPREFYEPLYFHAPFLKDKLITILRYPIYFFDKFAIQGASVIVVNSIFTKKKVKRIYNLNSIIIYPGFTELTHNMSSSKRNIQCLSVGSLLPYKGHELTIKAIGLLSKKPSLSIVGDGRPKDKEKLCNLALRNGVKITFFKRLSELELRNLYRTARVFINSAFQEPFGMSSLEALCYGDNLVTVNNCGTQELEKYFNRRVTIVQRIPRSIAKGIKDSLLKKNYETKVPKIFSWHHFSNELSKIIENE